MVEKHLSTSINIHTSASPRLSPLSSQTDFLEAQQVPSESTLLFSLVPLPQLPCSKAFATKRWSPGGQRPEVWKPRKGWENRGIFIMKSMGNSRKVLGKYTVNGGFWWKNHRINWLAVRSLCVNIYICINYHGTLIDDDRVGYRVLYTESYPLILHSIT